ncbi:unnamed protein product [Penicillium salamii]|uniref:Alpha-galactosidase n=1 Tax=Penicillium salamii TaxID=1612424 RepID=A0A9W4IMR7_9EURO|nr:unnamed protein product [Penicillium salamii]CAG8232316.1 unnamed protein product [Penicillium salamii]CAG8282698.1 unnamed protein product [Penicillium salamii]CAG8294481.1 unnamed protein product [Penicillium salamii]CAG8309177.1 unnamed protein product [Penicillium salamii]
MKVDSTSTLPIRGLAPNVKQSTKPVRSDQIAMFARVISYPPLGQLTCVRKPQASCSQDLRFTVTIESSSSFPAQHWEAQIWHNITDSEWTALQLQECDTETAPLLTGTKSDCHHFRHVFSGEITLPEAGGHAQFTVRFRTGPDTDWQWANQKHPVSDGEIIYCPRSAFDARASTEESDSKSREDLGRYIDNLSDQVEVTSRSSEAPGALLWSITGDVAPATDEKSSYKTLVLGTPSSTARYLSLVRVWSPWLGPRHGRDQFHLAEDAVLCSFLRTDGTHLVLLAVSGINDVLTIFQSGHDGEVVVKARSDNVTPASFHVLVAAADDFEIAMCAVVYEARKVVRPFAVSNPANEEQAPPSPLGDDVVVVEKDPAAQWLSEWFDGLTYCTWNGLGQDLTEKKLLEALDSLRDNGINIVNLIIDDGWQTNDHEGESQFKRGLKQFEAHPEGFPNGLKRTVDLIRQKNPRIEHIAVWHALLGYWGGISPDGALAQRFKTKQVRIKDSAANGPIAQNLPEGRIVAIDPEDIQRFYDGFYNYLSSAGIDSVKTDCQFFLDLLDDPADRTSFMTSYQDAWSIASLKHFGTRSISCGSMTPQIMFHSQMPTNKPTLPLRNSDDFFPEVPASHPWHIFCNAHNSLFTRYLNVLPDWDMFQTSHPYASFHAAARCVSGGPIYITDEPGKHDISLLDQMTAQTVTDITVILRPSIIGRTMDIYNDYNEGQVVRIGSYTGWAKTGSGILGLFNIRSDEASTIVSLMDFPGIHEDSQGLYIVRAHTSGKMSNLLRPLSNDSLVSIVLEPKGWEILTAYPTLSFSLKGSHGDSSPGDNLTHVAVLGLLGKMTGACAVVSSGMSMVESGRLRINISLKALGTVGVYISDLQYRSIESLMVMILGRPVPQKTVWKEGGDSSTVLAIDIFAAWKAMKLDSGWSNEALVQVYVG